MTTKPKPARKAARNVAVKQRQNSDKRRISDRQAKALREHAFKPGQSGNPAGRPKGRTIKEALVNALRADGITGQSNADEVATALLKYAKTGHVEILDRILALTEDVKPADLPGATHLLISLDK